MMVVHTRPGAAMTDRKANLDHCIAVILDAVRAGTIGYDQLRGRLFHRRAAGNLPVNSSDPELITLVIARGLRVPHVSIFSRAIAAVEAPLRAVNPVRMQSGPIPQANRSCQTAM